MGMFDFLTDVAAEVVAAPLTLTAKAVDLTVKTAEAIPVVAEKAVDKVADAFDKIGD